MGLPVVSVVAGGLPVVESTTGGTPVTEAANGYGVPVTKVISPAPGLPVVFETIGVGPAVPSLPAAITGVIGWWDASVTASLNLTGASINSIADQSGGGRPLVNVNATKPQYNATGFNTTKPAMVFTTASLTALQVTSFPMGTGNTLTAWAVCTLGSPSADFYCRILAYNKPGSSDHDNAGSWALNRNNNNYDQLMVSRVSNFPSGISVAVHPAGHRVILTINSSGNIVLYIDNVSVLTATSSGNWVSGGAVNVGRHGSANDLFWTGPIAEVGIATDYSNATAVGQLDAYLKNKWGL